MSNAVLPVLPGKGWSWTKSPTFKTELFRSMSQREVRLPMSAYPLWEFKLSYGVLRDDLSTQAPASPFDELKQMAGFFLSRNGSSESFLFYDNTDCSVADQLIGVGDAIETDFQLLRSYGGFDEPVMNVKLLTSLKVNGVTQNAPTDYTIDAAGLVTFNAPPADGLDIKWTGTYYYRCRFMDDSIDFEAFMFNLWSAKRVNFVGALGNKV